MHYKENLEELELKGRMEIMQTPRLLIPNLNYLKRPDGVDRLRVSRKEGERGLSSIKESGDISIQRLEDNIKSVEEYWLQPPETIQLTQTSTEQK